MADDFLRHVRGSADTQSPVAQLLAGNDPTTPSMSAEMYIFIFFLSCAFTVTAGQYQERETDQRRFHFQIFLLSVDYADYAEGKDINQSVNLRMIASLLSFAATGPSCH
jgi:hypothetical protein